MEPSISIASTTPRATIDHGRWAPNSGSFLSCGADSAGTDSPGESTLHFAGTCVPPPVGALLVVLERTTAQGRGRNHAEASPIFPATPGGGFFYLDHDQRVTPSTGFGLNLPRGFWTSGTVLTSSGLRPGIRRGSDIRRLAGVHPQPRFESPSDLLSDPRLFEFVAGLKTPEQIRRATQVNLDHGVDVIKTSATDRAGSPETDPRHYLFDENQLRAIVEVAARRGVPVGTHAHGDAGRRQRRSAPVSAASSTAPS